MKKNFIRTIAITILTTVVLTTPIQVFAKGEDPIKGKGDILTLGSDLKESEKQSLLKYFDAPSGTKTVYVTDSTIINQLGLDPNDPANYAGGCYSSAYVKLLDDGKGIKVTSSNLTEVTDSMLSNALITSGVLNAEIKASAPFPVTGTSALAGILAGVEDVAGYEISLKKKETAQKEIEVAMDLADQVGDIESSSFINDVKKEVIKDQPKTEKQIEKIVTDVASNYSFALPQEETDKVVSLMSDINDLGLDYSQLKDSLEQASNNFKDKLSEIGKELKDSGILEKAWNFISNMLGEFINWLKTMVNGSN